MQSVNMGSKSLSLAPKLLGSKPPSPFVCSRCPKLNTHESYLRQFSTLMKQIPLDLTNFPDSIRFYYWRVPCVMIFNKQSLWKTYQLACTCVQLCCNKDIIYIIVIQTFVPSTSCCRRKQDACFNEFFYKIIWSY